MKSFLASVTVLVFASTASAQLYPGTPHGLIPDNTPAGISQSIVITDPGSVLAVEVGVTFSPAHTWAGDIDMTISHNNGTNTVSTLIMSSIGAITAPAAGDSSDLGGPYVFSDTGGDMWAAAATAAGTSPIPAGTYRAFTNAFTGVAATSYVPVNLNTIFGGRSIAGTWSLLISDNAAGDAGSVSAWHVNFVPAPGALALLGLAGLVGSRRRRVA